MRLLHFGIYICMFLAGIGILSYPSYSYERVLGWGLVITLGIFLAAGALLSGIAVLPGIWWLERVGLICMITGMAIYVVVILDLGARSLGLVVPIAFTITFVLRWMEIRRYQLAPREE